MFEPADFSPVMLAPADCGPPMSASDFGSEVECIASSIFCADVGLLDDGIRVVLLILVIARRAKRNAVLRLQSVWKANRAKM